MIQEEFKLEFEAVKVPEKTAQILKEMYNAGYRYVVKDGDMNLTTCFSLKPRKYQDGEYWGYANPDEPGALPAYPLVGIDLPDVKWTNRSATLIENFLEGGERS